MGIALELLPNCGPVTLTAYLKGSLQEKNIVADSTNEHIFRGREFTFVVKEHTAQARRFVEALNEVIYDNLLAQEEGFRDVREAQMRLSSQRALLQVMMAHPDKVISLVETPFTQLSLVFRTDARFLLSRALHQFEFDVPKTIIAVQPS